MDSVIPLHNKAYGKIKDAAFLYAFAPGRVNLLGAHVDYLGGHVLPAALTLGCHMVFTAEPSTSSNNNKWTFSFCSANVKDGSEIVTFTMDDKATIRMDRSFRTVCFGAVWQAWKLHKMKDNATLAPQHIKVAMDGKVPIQAGLSGSVTIAVAVILGLTQYFDPTMATKLINNNEQDKNAIVEYKRQVANAARQVKIQNMGVTSGPMDQYISLFAVEHHVLNVDCVSLSHEVLPLPDPQQHHYGWVLINSMRAHDMAEASNAMVSSVHAAERKITEYVLSQAKEMEEAEASPTSPSINNSCKFPTLGLSGKVYLRELVGKHFDSHLKPADWLNKLHSRGVLDAEEFSRTVFAVEEMERVDQYIAYTMQKPLAADPPQLLRRLGQLMYETHKGLAEQLLVTTPELDTLVELCKRTEGVYGARFMGGGYGGCVLALVDTHAFTAEARRRLTAAFQRAFPSLGENSIMEVAFGRGAFIKPL